MPRIYDEKTETLAKLLEWASGRDTTSTMLIPDLQRPYVWTPQQVTLLVDSLIRGWPFGTLLLWSVRDNDVATIPARAFWTVFDETPSAVGSKVGRINPPAEFRMVLDGQQRLQSLLIAVGGDSFGFKRLDRDWCELLDREKPRGKYAAEHWSHGQLAIDLTNFRTQVAGGRGVLEVDYRDALAWVIRGANDLSTRPTPPNYKRPLEHADEHPGRFIRFSRLWDMAKPQAGLFEDDFLKMLTKVFDDHKVPPDVRQSIARPLAQLLMTLAQVKQAKVAFLELAPFDPETMSRDVYTDAIVNIFTRLNTAGRALTRQEITFAWIKAGWDDQQTNGRTATVCFDELRQDLRDSKLVLETDEVVAAVSTLWAIFRNEGRMLTSQDLLSGAKVKPMATDLVALWQLIPRILTENAELLDSAGLGQQRHIRSLNAAIVLGAWRGLGVMWGASSKMSTLERDAFDKKLDAMALGSADRWILASLWAGRWGKSSDDVFAKYVSEIAKLWSSIKSETEMSSVLSLLDEQMTKWIQDLHSDAADRVRKLWVDDRSRVHEYFLPLWIWHRLSRPRWAMSQVQLREAKKKKIALEVDHAVAFAKWQALVGAAPITPPSSADVDSNWLGNCSLLEKSFNISKGKQSMRPFLEHVHEFESGAITVNDWAKALEITDPLLDPDKYSLVDIRDAIQTRTELIKDEIVSYLKGGLSRVDL